MRSYLLKNMGIFLYKGQTMNAIKKLLVANRGEITVRIIRTCKILGVQAVAIFSKFDIASFHTQQADKSFFIRGDKLSDNYLNINRLIKISKRCGAEAIHPGYGFLSENDVFTYNLLNNNITLIGPHYSTIKSLGNKVQARKIMSSNKISIIPGTSSIDCLDKAIVEAASIGYPLLIKAAAGGGGRGMRYVDSNEQLKKYFAVTQNESLIAFGSNEVYLEKYLLDPKHIEVQIIADNYNNISSFIERDCSVQRRNQKIIEETPCLLLNSATRKKIIKCAQDVAKVVSYTGVGTVEFLVDIYNNYYFMEMNTRIQVEHLVTEMVTSTDIVEMQINVANGAKINNKISLFSHHGHAIEARVYAETPDFNFFPSSGEVDFLHIPGGPFVRIDSGVTQGVSITSYYDPMLMKVGVWGYSRDIAIKRLEYTLKETVISGCITNISFLLHILKFDDFKNGSYNINVLSKLKNNFVTNKDSTSSLIISAIKSYSINCGFSI